MSLFERLGERVEEFKQEAESARDDTAPYLCRDCGERFHQAQKTCPACGSEQLAVRKDVASSAGDSTSASESDSEAESDTKPESDPADTALDELDEPDESDESDDPTALITEAESEETEQTDDGA
ncbi:hypothetical protein C483_02770 [Natrialba hulunbeirensis JCM 10989]|uniref:DUF35 domain-containing protein n=1 Tax=Natrialba hulunbeirensis JCM 10989 TaxID=1227493 RepID=M0A7V9_9EURY|nr:hypothetical protein [Natrialba hulunbeirensis]ELY94619.1 hypothetical protein C483_02770 [Natrialba hulunbeirensis JCM 10989]